MAFSQKFSDVTCDILPVRSLTVNRQYRIVKAESVRTRYGETILLRDLLSLSVRDLAPQLLKMFLPKRYSTVFQDDVITSINEGQIVWNLVYKGQCENTNTRILAIE